MTIGQTGSPKSGKDTEFFKDNDRRSIKAEEGTGTAKRPMMKREVASPLFCPDEGSSRDEPIDLDADEDEEVVVRSEQVHGLLTPPKTTHSRKRAGGSLSRDTSDDTVVGSTSRRLFEAQIRKKAKSDNVVDRVETFVTGVSNPFDD